MVPRTLPGLGPIIKVCARFLGLQSELYSLGSPLPMLLILISDCLGMIVMIMLHFCSGSKSKNRIPPLSTLAKCLQQRQRLPFHQVPTYVYSKETGIPAGIRSRCTACTCPDLKEGRLAGWQAACTYSYLGYLGYLVYVCSSKYLPGRYSTVLCMVGSARLWAPTLEPRTRTPVRLFVRFDN